MCEYCAYNKDFWSQILEGAKRIRILTPDEVTALERRLAEQKLARDTQATQAEVNDAGQG